MKRIVVGALAVLLLATLFMASPFWSAWRIREAVRTGDSAYLTEKIAWESVRASLKASILRHANLVPEVDAADRIKPPSLWQRVKLAFGQPMIDSFVERNFTPEGLPRLFAYKQEYARKERGGAVGSEQPETEDVQAFLKRVKRAEFQSATRLELEIADESNPRRHYVSRLELAGFNLWRDFGPDWRLTSVRVVAAPDLPAELPLRLQGARAGLVSTGVR
jgi:hypothetical protein